MYAGLGTIAFAYVVPLTIALLAVLAVLLFSYRQTIKAYPQAGGAYLVTRDNFGLLPAQLAGVSLLTDYILTVSVSVAAGTAALTSVYEGLFPLSRSDIARVRVDHRDLGTCGVSGRRGGSSPFRRISSSR